MNYHEKKTIVTSIVGLAVSLSYLLFAIIKYNEGSAESLTLKFWASKILIFVGIGVIAIIVVLILFNIFYSIYLAYKLKTENPELTDKEIENQISQIVKTNTLEDEMAKLIELKSTRIGFAIAGFGFILALVSLLLNFSPVIMLNILFLSFSLGSALEGFVQLYYYKRGINHA
jgi:hypothetical protein